jgi:N-acetylmuramic acid 6-phosphate etherase
MSEGDDQMNDAEPPAAIPASTAPSAGHVRVESPTERINPRTVDIDRVSTEDALRMLNAEDRLVAPAVTAVVPDLARLVDEAAIRIRAGGRVHYFGAGTSGRLAVLDAAELLPTFGLGDVVVAHHAGGTAALVEAIEDVEDSEDDGAAAAEAVATGDLAIGLTASGRTPYVGGALRAARRLGAFTALMTSNPQPALADVSDLVLAADTGPEAITGSTRLKAGTAEKLMLNGFSTVLMVRLGRVYSNLMIDMQATNAKLRGRSVEVLVQATGASFDDCTEVLAAAGDIKTALLVLLTTGGSEGSTISERITGARRVLAATSGMVRDALRLLDAGDRS